GRVIGIDGTTEFPLALVVLPGSLDATEHAPATDRDPPEHPVEPISRAPITFPLLVAAQRDGDLADDAAVRSWRAIAAGRGDPTRPGVAPPPAAPDEPIGSVILRRGSTRIMRPAPVPSELLTWGLGVAARAVDADIVAPGTTLLDHYVAVHDVAGVEPGAFR